MAADDTERAGSGPILDYAVSPASDDIPFLPAMRIWRSVAFWSLLVFIGGALSNRLLAAVGLGALLAASVMTLLYMTRAATTEVSTSYALRHLFLAIALTPILFLGVFVVPVLVQLDLIKWRDAARRTGTADAPRPSRCPPNRDRASHGGPVEQG